MGALRLGPSLRLPGTAVQLLHLPKGLAADDERLATGLLGDDRLAIALGPAPAGRSRAHRYSVAIRGLSRKQLEQGLVERRMEDFKVFEDLLRSFEGFQRAAIDEIWNDLDIRRLI